MDNESQCFAETVESLLRGDVACEYSAELSHKFLCVESNFQEVDRYLRRLGRCLRRTVDGTACFAAYSDIGSDAATRAIRAQFAEVIQSLEPLVRWLELARSAQKTDRPIHPGDPVRESHLLEAIENAQGLREELDRLSRTPLLGNRQSDSKGQLRAVLDKLRDAGYLVVKGKSGAVYTATGKWSRLYDLMDFIAAHERLDTSEDEAEQETFVL